MTTHDQLVLGSLLHRIIVEGEGGGYGGYRWYDEHQLTLDLTVDISPAEFVVLERLPDVR